MIGELTHPHAHKSPRDAWILALIVVAWLVVNGC